MIDAEDLRKKGNSLTIPMFQIFSNEELFMLLDEVKMELRSK